MVRWQSIAAACLLTPCLAAACASPPAAADQADLIVQNGKVYPGVDGVVTDAVAVRGTTILRVGSAREIDGLRGPRTQVVDAHGGTIAPGFNDSHVHFLSGALALDQVDLGGLTALAPIQEKIRAFAAAHPGQPWVVGRGWLYSPFPGGLPTREQLDAAVPDRPAVMTCYDGHSVWANSKALQLAGITRATPDPPNGIVVKDRAGEPTGVLKESAQALLGKVIPRATHDEKLAAIRAASSYAHTLGVTSVQSTSGTLEDAALFAEAEQKGDLSVRTYYSLLILPGFSEADADRFEAARKQHPDGARFRTGIVKLSLDGVIESRTAALLAPYAGSTSSGAPNFPAAELNQIVAMMDRRGWQIQIHAIGDRAVRMTLDAFEHAIAVNPPPARGRRHRIEHVETIDPADIPRFAKLGVIASMQPIHAELGDMNTLHPSGPWPDNLGAERASRAWQWKSIRDAGGRITFGSDWGVATLDPLQGIWLAATRLTPAGMRDQHLSMAEAVNGYTSWAAYASFEDQRKGTLAAGMLADIVVLSRDIMAEAPVRPPAIAVDTTIVDGKVVYRRAR